MTPQTREPDAAPHVVIVGAGFAGLGCAKELAKHDRVRVTVIDKHNYHQFQPLLYQVATAQLAPPTSRSTSARGSGSIRTST